MSAIAIPNQPVSKLMLNAVILYDAPELAAKSKALLEKIGRADQVLQWCVIPWRLDLLAIPALATAALEDAKDAHLIVLAIRPTANLSPLLLDWLHRWATHRHVKDAALAWWTKGRGESLPATAIAGLSRFAEYQDLNLIFEPTIAPGQLSACMA